MEFRVFRFLLLLFRTEKVILCFRNGEDRPLPECEGSVGYGLTPYPSASPETRPRPGPPTLPPLDSKCRVHGVVLVPGNYLWEWYEPLGWTFYGST